MRFNVCGWCCGVTSSDNKINSVKMVDAEVTEKLDAGFQKLQDAEECKSLLKKYLTEDVYNELKDKSTPSFNSTLLDVIQSGKHAENYKSLASFHDGFSKPPVT